MAKVQVWNDNVVKNAKGELIGYTLEEEFKGQKIVIPPGEYIEMSRGEAVKFKGSYHPVQKDGMNQQIEASYKKIRIVELKKEKEAPVFVCNQDGTEHKSQAALDKYIAENFADQIQDQNFAQEFKKKVTKKKTA